MRPTRGIALIVVLQGLAGADVRAQTVPVDPTLARTQEAAGAMLKGDVKAGAAAAIKLFTEALQDPNIPNDRRASILNDRAVAYGRVGQTKLAIDDFNRATQLFPEYAAVYNNRGNTLLAMGQPREAIKDFDRAILLTPGYAAAFHNRAGAYMRLGQTSDAIRDYTKAIEMIPTNAAPLSGRGRAFLAEARPHAAMRDFSRALQNDARFGSAYRSRGEAKIAVDRFEEAVEDLSRAIAFDPSNAEVFILRGYAYLASNNAVAAIKDFSRAIELDGRSIAGYQGRGLAHAKADASEEAEADLARAIELDPRAAMAFAYRGYVYKITAQPELGLKEVEKALRIDANLAEAHWAKGEIEEALGKIDDSIASLRRALVLKPSLKDATEGLDRLGAAPDTSADVEVAGGGIGNWRIVTRAARFYAISSDFPKIRVPLEMMGTGAPRLLGWDLRKAPLQGIGTLKFHAGRTGSMDIEQVAIVDMQASTVIGIQPESVGDRKSKWTWDDARVTIASIDGVTDEFVLRAAKPKELTAEAKPKTETAPAKRVVNSGEVGSAKGTPSWAPWSQSGWSGSAGGGQQQARGNQRPAPKPKTLFDILLGN